MDKDWGLSALYDDGKGECWMGCWFHGFRNYNFSTKKFTDYFFEKKSDSVITRDIQTIEYVNVPGLESYLWLGTDNELALFDLNKRTFAKYYKHSAEVSTSLPAGFINKIFYDGRNGVWFGTENGLHYARLNQRAFQTYIFPEMESNEIGRIRESVFDKNYLMIGFHPGGIYKLNKNSGEISDKYVPEKAFEFGYNYIKDFVQSSQNTFWVANHTGLASYNIQTGKYHLYNKAYKGFGNEEGSVYNLVMDGDSVVWFSSARGFGKFNIHSESFKYYSPSQVNAKTKDRGVSYIMKDFSGNIWVSTRYSGILLFNPRTELFKKISFGNNDIKYSTDFDITQSPDSGIWCTFGERIWHKNKNDDQFQLVHSHNINGAIYRIACDKKNNLYLTTQTGLVKYETSSKRFIKFTTSDGLYANRLSEGIDVGSNGELYLHGKGYITIINPEELHKQYLPAPVIFDSFKINGSDSIFNFSSYSSHPITLSYKQNQFSVNFRLLNFEDVQLVKYVYKLEGWDRNWISSGASTHASYSNLSGGDYILHVKAINPDGMENPQQATLMIHFNLPFWETTWFRILACLIVISIAYSIYRLRIQRLLAVQRVRSEISRDLHDEIGASLSSVHIMSAFAEKSMDENSDDAKRWMSRIGDNSKEMMEKIRDIVWTLNSSKEISGNLITRMNQFISHTLEPKNITCHFDSDERVNEVLTGFVNKRNVYLIFKEALNNAAKYSGCTEVTISLVMENKKVILCIADNGKGFELSQAVNGNGLINMRQRASEINATLEINSSLNHGTSVTMILPLPHLRYRFLKNAD